MSDRSDVTEGEEFVAIDVETANPDVSSICQIGLALFRDCQLVDEWKSLVDPEGDFDPVNTSIHGIDAVQVSGAPRLPDVSEVVFRHLDGRIAVCHTHFDQTSITRACDRYGLRHPSCQWLDSARVARRTWDEFAWSGYGLGSVCGYLGYRYKQHDALEDAKAAAHVLVSAMTKTGRDLSAWIERVELPLDGMKPRNSGKIEREGNPTGRLHGEVVVFTGALTMSRSDAADLAAGAGCDVEAGVTKRTTMLVVGDIDIRTTAGHERTSKHRKAEELIARGRLIRILRESDFRQIVRR